MPTITLCMLLVHIHQARRFFFSITPHISLIQEPDLTYSNVSRERFGGDIPRILFCWDIWGFHDVFLNLLMKLIRITWIHSIYRPSLWVLFAKCKHLTLTLLVLMCLFNRALCFASLNRIFPESSHFSHWINGFCLLENTTKKGIWICDRTLGLPRIRKCNRS